MDIGKISESLMVMSERTWERHANPWSGWTRLASFPVLFLAAWSHVWIGIYSLIPIGITCLWIWLNPRLFPVPRSSDSWMSRVVKGERIWIARKKCPIPRGHEKAVFWINLISLTGLGVCAYGFIAGEFWPAFMGWNTSVLCKMWFADRMVWLYEDTQRKTMAHGNDHRTSCNADRG